MVSLEVHQGFKGHFLNELRVSFNLFDEFNARCVHLFPQEEEYIQRIGIQYTDQLF